MKKLIAVLGMSAVVLSCGLFCVSCSDDDNEGGEGGSGGSSDVETCYLDVDGKRVNFKYAYYYSFDFEEDSEGECRLDFYDIDMMYYYKHPDKIKEGIIYSSASIDFYNVSGLATDTYTDVAVGIYLNTSSFCEVHPRRQIFSFSVEDKFTGRLACIEADARLTRLTGKEIHICRNGIRLSGFFKSDRARRFRWFVRR